jgi:hypothetical protein
MWRQHWRRGKLVVGVVFILGAGCGSSAPPLAPIPDPGGPFQTSVPPNRTLDALTSEQYQELCNELAAAPYLQQGLNREWTCRVEGIEFANRTSLGIGDGGADGGSFLSVCQAAHDNCQQQPIFSSPCSVPAHCTATVELLSACVNELANTDPVATCLAIPSCAMVAATGKADPISIGPCPNGPSPACTRLAQQCPGALQGFFPGPTI